MTTRENRRATTRNSLFATAVALLIITLAGCPQNPFFGLVPSPRDEEGPAITIINPEAGQAVSGTLVVTGIATDKYQVTEVSVRVGSGNPVRAEGTNTWYHTVDTTGLGEGEHTITIIAVDQWNNVSEKSVAIYVDQTVPEVAIPYHPGGFENYFSGSNVTLSGQATDDDEVVRVQISFDGGVTWSDTNLTGSGGSRTWSYTIADTSAVIPGDGSTTMVLRAYDNAGLIGSSALLVYFDNTPPSISVLVPEDDVTINSSEDLQSDTLVVSGTAADNLIAGVDTVEILIRDGLVPGNPIRYAVTLEATDNEGIKNYSRGFDLTTIDLDGHPDPRNYGPVVIQVVATDRAGNATSTSVRVSLDNDPPAFDAIEIGGEPLDNDPANPANNLPDGTHVITGAVSLGIGDSLPGDVESVEVMAGTSENSGSVFEYEPVDNPNDGGLEPGAVNGTGEWSYTLDTDRFATDGVYYVTFRVTNDRGGFDRVSKRVRVDREDPTVVISSPSHGASVSGTNVSISGTVSGTGSLMQFIDLVITDDVGGEETVLVETRFTHPDFTTPDPASGDTPHPDTGETYGAYAELAYSGGGFSWSWDTSTFTSGADIRIEVTATDMAGNTFTRTVVVTQDPNAPIGRFEEYDHPTNEDFHAQPLFPGRFINGAGTIRGTAAGVHGITAVDISTDNENWVGADDDLALLDWEFTLSRLPGGGLSEGTHTIYLRVTDGVDAANTISIVVEVDNTNPQLGTLNIDLLDGSDTPYYHGTVSVTGTADDSESGVASVTVTVGDQAEALDVDGVTFYEAMWNTQALPTDGVLPVIAQEGIPVRSTATDQAGNVATVEEAVDVRPYVASVSRPSAYLGEAGIRVFGNNLGRVGAESPVVQVTIGGGPVQDEFTVTPNEVTFAVPGTFPPEGGLSSGPVVVTFNGASNAAQEPVKMDLFHLRTVTDDRSPSYPDAVWHDNGTGGRLIYAYMGSQQNNRWVHFHDGTTRRELVTATGGGFPYTRVAGHDGSDLVFVTRSRNGLVIRSTTDDFDDLAASVTATLSATATYNDIAVDSDGMAHIAYYEGGELRYRQWGGAAGTPPTDAIVIDGAGSDAGMWVAITVDSNDRPHVVYHDATANSMKYSYRTSGGAWVTPRTIDASAAGTFGNGIAIDGTGAIHISYYNGDSGNLMYAYASGPTSPFATQIVDSQGITGWFSSIAVDSSNRPHITYASFSTLKPRYARMTIDGFETVTVAEAEDYDINGNSNSTATVIDGDGYVNMIYTTDDELRRAVYFPEN